LTAGRGRGSDRRHFDPNRVEVVAFNSRRQRVESASSVRRGGYCLLSGHSPSTVHSRPRSGTSTATRFPGIRTLFRPMQGCHRRLLITPALEERSIEVVHIRGDGQLQPEEGQRSSSPQLALFE